MKTYLCVPEVRAKIIALRAKLKGDNFMHGADSEVSEEKAAAR